MDTGKNIQCKPTVSFLLIVLTFIVTGCGEGLVSTAVSSATIAQPTAPATEPPTETPVPTHTLIPTETPTPFIPIATIKIVVHVPLSGDFSNFGIDIARAAEFAVEQLSGPLNELGYKIELISYDDRMEIATAVENANEIVADSEILCGVGHLASRIMIQASEIYHKAGLAFVSPSNTDPTVTDRGYLEVNRVVGRDDGNGIVGAQFAKDTGITSVYIITSSWELGRKNAENFKREADRIGLKVVGMLNTDVADDFEGVVKRVMNAGPDMVYFASNVGQAGPFFRQARAAGYMGTFMGMESNSSVVDLAGPLLIEGGGMYYVDTVAPASNYLDAGKFFQDFDTYYGTPQAFAAQAYDATGICMKAIEEASRARGGEIPTRGEVANAIRALQGYKGITGTYNFNKNGDPDPAQYVIFQVVSPDINDWGQNTMVATYEISPPK